MGGVAGWLFDAVGVGGGEGDAGCRCGGYWIFLVYMGMGYGGVGCKIEAVCGRGRVLRFTLEDVELVEVRSLYAGLTCFTFSVDSAGC